MLRGSTTVCVNTGSAGYYSITLAGGKYVVTVTVPLMKSVTKTVTFMDTYVQVNFALVPKIQIKLDPDLPKDPKFPNL